MNYSPHANTIHKIINDLYSGSSINYLELGLNCGTNFASLLIENKKSVDVKYYQLPPTYLMSTDQFFDQNNDKFDLIYIDADHEYSQVIKDYNNSIDCIVEDGIVFLHDLYPPNEEHTQPQLCYNSYKILNYFIENNYDILVNKDDFGSCAVFSSKKIDLSKFNHDITYKQFTEKFADDINLLISYDDFLKKYKKRIKND